MKDDFVNRTERALSRIILPLSGTMIGVCATMIGLVKVLETQTGPSHVDEYLSLVLLLFLASSLLSYVSIRNSGHRLARYVELAADISFLIGLVCLSAVGLFFSYEII
jgi:uncharacterized membrane protein